MHVYPETIPVEAVQTLFQAGIDPANADKKKLVAAGYQMAGYALGQIVGEPDAPVQLIGANGVSTMAQLHNQVTTAPVGKMNETWQTVMTYAIMLAMALLAREQKTPMPFPTMQPPTP